ncbi:tRNA adenosine(34) deaminase TadA [Coraliomargarita akajimensis]|uniref:tRNA-specific adenosine deaminase n=1 Tax=Coraliomargarita akajimensis (strain DSM 45221 / IAM 15411 / JCM 23193 / KCTC 12865 / 04OKA010-24) TaxID=583355 RepID=D5EKK4_CORAD|nr:tRNA adenosine(34) deaminase TadA [Coraliomargarita akajimensis]ADE54911.1 CMP/dCMP deaminase zinc-binding protein [Coraliomargarita akajimensis DSM 45221]
MTNDCPFDKIYPSELNRNEDYFMAHAFNEAIEAWKKDEVPIGAVIEYEGRIIASAHNQSRSTNDPTAHAEILAISQAANTLGDWRLNECRLYVTKEPCPMCSGALVIARIGKVYYGLPDEKMGCVGGAVDLGALPRSNHHFESIGGVMEDANHAILKAFFEKKRAINAAKKEAARLEDPKE